MAMKNNHRRFSEFFDLQGKIALVTGSARGLGREIALALARQRASLVLADIDPPLETAGEVSLTGSHAMAVKTDVSKEASIRNLIKKVVDRFQRVDILVNNAGISQLKFEPTEDAGTEEWDRVIQVNLRGTYLCCKHVGKHMIEKGGGNIINVASTAGFNGVPRAPAYCASKAGVILLTKSLALEWAKYHIRVNAIAPHYLETELTKGLRASEKAYEGLVRQIPLKRFGRTEELVGTMLLLASDTSSYMTGSIVVVDGGFLA